ncbi:MAG: N-acetyltransferase [Proteobacteria bacterium]|nr:N-acetyltransferase [Pseudomonadota bacterium]
MGDIEEHAVTAKLVGDISAIPADQWDACAGTANPFVRHAFLKALEDSKSVCAEAGWAPYHLLIEDDAGAPAAVAPMYVKGHSQGEYIFDHAWAHAYERAGGRYYPKLLIAVPFTPATGPRLLVRPDQDRKAMQGNLIVAGVQAAQQLELSSLNVNFPTEDEWNTLGEAGFLQRTGEQFHWLNEGYETFDDFLDALTSRKRKAIRKERRESLTGDVSIEAVSGSGLTEAHWDAFYQFYVDTGNRKWGQPYLNREFFSLLGQAMPDSVVLIMATRGGRFVAGALNLRGADTLFGRYWGCIEDHRFLHFEVCYYQAIEYAITHGLARVEAGAQGPHKLSRGYLPVHTYSAHWIGDPGFRRAVKDYLEHERAEVDQDIGILDAHSPFKKPPPGAERE